MGINMGWRDYVIGDESTHPKKDVDLWYFFVYVGVHKGKFYGEHCFAGDHGFLTEDVTHWQYDEGQDKPTTPKEFGDA